MATRYDKTLADYLVIAISPALIMTLVGSLVFFLLEVFYQGNFGGRLHYILTLFIFAAVLIGRISIEEDAERAALFALPLGAATLVAIAHFVQFQGALLGQASLAINCGLLGLIWWCAHRLTWDCTMIDETESASGEGLLDAAGLGQRAGAESEAPGKMGLEVRQKTTRWTWWSTLRSPKSRRARMPVGSEQRAAAARGVVASAGPPAASGGPALAALASPIASSDEDAPSRRNAFRTPRGKPHSPGVWVIYFSLAALPIFGFGQMAIPTVHAARRQYVFLLLAVYVASGLGLLLTTSFLGLRRYLRQRRLPMPLIMTGTWIALGCLLIVGVMGLALLLPRPNAEFAVSQIPHVMGSPDQTPSKHGIGNDGAKGDEPGHAEPGDNGSPARGSGDADRRDEQQPNQAGNETSNSGNADRHKPQSSASDDGNSNSNKPDDRASDSGRGTKSSGNGAETRQQPGDRSGRSQDGGKSPSGQSSEKTPDAGTNPPPAEPSPPESPSPPPIDFASAFAWLLPVLQVLFYLVIVGLAAYWAWRHRAGILAAIRDLFAGLGSFWDRLFGGRSKSARAKADRPPRPRRFADFADPFAPGMVNQLTADQLVRYLFEAVEAWARENGCPREPEQTPHEFARSIGQQDPALLQLAICLADLYCQAAYAPGRLTISDRQPLQGLWRELKKRTAAADEPWLAGR